MVWDQTWALGCLEAPQRCYCAAKIEKRWDTGPNKLLAALIGPGPWPLTIKVFLCLEICDQINASKSEVVTKVQNVTEPFG